MGFRFSKRVRLMPGVRLNVGKRGASLSVGPRGASVTVGKSGVFGNVGIPGTGLSYRGRLDGGGRSHPSRPAPPALPTRIVATLADDGQTVLTDGDGRPIEPSLMPSARRSAASQLLPFLEAAAEERNGASAGLDAIHLDAPREVARARSPACRPVETDFSDRSSFVTALMDWRADEANRGPDEDAIGTALLDALGALDWPRETDVAIEVRGDRVLLDVDLPEIEDMPSRRWTVDGPRVQLREAALPRRELADTYLRHVGSILCRLAGHCFAATDAVKSIALSGYTQRPAPSGGVRDEYVIVADVGRNAWNAALAAFGRSDTLDLLDIIGAEYRTTARGTLARREPLG